MTKMTQPNHLLTVCQTYFSLKYDLKKHLYYIINNLCCINFMIYSVITSAKHGCFILYQENIIAYLNESADSHGFPEKKKYML